MFEVGDIVWYKTGIFSASKVEILAINGSGATLSYIIRFIDTAPDQPDSVRANVGHWTSRTGHRGGGISISAKKCVALTEEQKHLYKVQTKVLA